MALRAVGEERFLQVRMSPDIGQKLRVVELRPRAVPRVTTQTQECRRLNQEVIVNCAVGFMTDCTILRHRGMFIHERPLEFGVAAIADEVDRRFLQELERLPVRIVAVAADHLPFPDRVV